MANLFRQREKVAIARVASEDVKGGSTAFRQLQELIQRREHLYPDIQNWLSRRVVPGFRAGERIGFVGYLNEDPVAAAVVKAGMRTKFCHLYLEPNVREGHLGEVLFTLMTFEVSDVAQEIHFSLPRGLWERERGFFESFGFRRAKRHRVQYRPKEGEEELGCSSAFQDVWQAAEDKLPRLFVNFSAGEFGLDGGIVMSLRPRQAEAILKGHKRVEVRRRFSERWLGRRAALYASRPMAALCGEVLIADVYQAPPEMVWSRYGSELGCSRAEYQRYVGDAEQIWAISLEEAASYVEPIPLKSLTTRLKIDLRPPVSYTSVDASRAWQKVMTLAALEGFSRAQP